MEPELNKTGVLDDVCGLLSGGHRTEAGNKISELYPFEPPKKVVRKLNDLEQIRIFVRDGFVDQYSGRRLVLPGALRLISELIPDYFPYQKNWKMSATHIAFWELSSTIDHVNPIARGGSDTESNIVTTSMLMNAAKSHWTLEELGWETFSPGKIDEWDGLSHWFLNYTSSHPEALPDSRWKSYREAVTQALGRE
jgi:hypothetical protein